MQALKHMQQDKTDRGAALREAAMRQHDRIIDAATEVCLKSCHALNERPCTMMLGALCHKAALWEVLKLPTGPRASSLPQKVLSSRTVAAVAST